MRLVRINKRIFPIFLCLIVCSPLPGLAEESVPQPNLSVGEDDPFLISFPFFFSYESGQWVSSSPGKIFTEGSLVPDFTLPYLKEKPEPIRYPKWALGQGWKGTLLVAIEILETGNVGRWKIMRSTGHELLDNAAVKAIRKWKFEPGKQKEKPIVSCIQIPIYFVLDTE